MTEVKIVHNNETTYGFELSVEEADFLISNGYQYRDKLYQSSDKHAPVAMEGLYGDIVINSVRKDQIKKG